MLLEGDDYGSIRRFCARVNIGESAWGNYERGTSPPSLGNAMLLVKLFPGLTLDWIYRGRTEGLSVRMAADLEGQPIEDTRSA